MRIAYDHQAFCRQTAGGISRYFCRLAEELSYKQQEIGIFAPFYRNVYLKDLAPNLVHGCSVKNYPPKTAGLCVSVNAAITRPWIRQWKPDLVHETYFDKRGVSSVDCPKVITVFDMIGELDELNDQKRYSDIRETAKYQSINRAHQVICISEHTRKDLIRLFNVAEQKVSVVYLGTEQNIKSVITDTDAKRNFRKPFLLYVGLRGGYKNFEKFLQSIASSSELQSSFDVIAFGGGKFTVDEQVFIEKLGFKEKQIRQMSGTDQELNHLYQNAAAFVYPSKYEGFGLPPLEAMAAHCPVVSSNASSMPEVIGDAAEFFDPNQIDSIRVAIEQVVFSESKKQELVKKGVERVKQFTWAQCAEKTLDIYRTVAQLRS